MANNGGVAVWSKTAANNASADSTVNYAEGQAPSSLNDSARAAMASVAKWRDDIAGSTVTTGTSTAYIVASNQDFVNITDLAGQVIAFTPHLTNGTGPVTMTVDGFANLPLRSAPNTELLAGVLVQGTPYLATYNNTDHALYLQSFFGPSPAITSFLIPLGGMIDYIGTTAPTSQFALPFGQGISRTTYATLFALVGTTFGNGDGSTTFNVPDLRGRVCAGVDNMGGTAASRLTSTYFGANADVLGAVGGSQSETLVTANLPPYTPSGSVSTANAQSGNATPQFPDQGGSVKFAVGGTSSGGSLAQPMLLSSTFTGNAQGGSSTPIATVPPTITMNKLLRII